MSNHILAIKVLIQQKITLVGKDMITTDEKQFAHIMNEKLVIITKNISSKHSISSKDSDSDFL